MDYGEAYQEAEKLLTNFKKESAQLEQEQIAREIGTITTIDLDSGKVISAWPPIDEDAAISRANWQH